MNIGHLIVQEIWHRKWSFALGVLSVLIAVGCVTAEFTLLDLYDQRTEQLVTATQEETRARLVQKEEEARAQRAHEEDRYRQIMVDLGYNLRILPRDQPLGDFYADDYASRYMPEDWAQKLVKARVVTINHVLPILQQRFLWPEQKRTVLLMGVRGEVLLQSKKQKPILDLVPPGSVVVGHELADSLQLKVGDEIELKGRPFTVSKVRPRTGRKEDITLWINLADAQALLDKKGLINEIQALECGCDVDQLGKVREEIARVLPDTQVEELAPEARARADVRNTAARASAEVIDKERVHAAAVVRQEKDSRTALRNEREALAAVLVPLVLLGCATWIAFLTLANVRERRTEIAILRALGVRRHQVLVLFLGKALLLGLVGAGLGYLGGILIGTLAQESGGDAGLGSALINPRLLLAVLAAAPVLAVLAAWLPALLAVRQDPATILCEE